MLACSSSWGSLAFSFSLFLLRVGSGVFEWGGVMPGDRGDLERMETRSSSVICPGAGSSQFKVVNLVVASRSGEVGQSVFSGWS